MRRRQLSARIGTAGERRLLRLAFERNTEAFHRSIAASDRSVEASDRSIAASDRSMEASDRSVAASDRSIEASDRSIDASDRGMEAHDRLMTRLDENTIFIREMNRRNELVTQQIIRDHQEFMAELRQSGEAQSGEADRARREAERDRKVAERDRKEANRRTERILVRLDEASQESKAFREALLALIDRLPPPQAA